MAESAVPNERHEAEVRTLVELWFGRFDAGEDVAATDICAGRPDLLSEVERRIAHLRLLEAHRQGLPRADFLTPILPPLLPVLPGYEILGELGRGGNGIVYQARETRLKRLVAIKLLLAGRYASPEHRVRFQREAESIGGLQHPHIIQIYTIGDQEGLPFLVLELCAGGNLATRLKEEPLPTNACAVLVERLARAIAHAHTHDIVHRDLKPSNILFTADGTPKITDFGVAKHVASQTLTNTGHILGTAAYMAPEQARGMKDVGPSVDVYALGAILYECLTGKPPFHGETFLATLEMVKEQQPLAPSEIVPNVDPILEAVCLRCLRKSATDRYASAQKMADELARWQTSQPSLASTVDQRAVVTKSLRLMILSAAAGLLALLTILVIPFLRQNKSSDHGPVETIPPVNGTEARPEAKTEADVVHWIQSVKGEVEYSDGKTQKEIKAGSPLPGPPFFVRWVKLYRHEGITDDHIKQLTTFGQLLMLSLDGLPITDAGLRPLKDMKHLSWLRLTNLQNVTDDGMASLRELTGLAQLSLQHCHHIGNKGLQHLSGLRRLNYLDLENTQVSDDGLNYLRPLQGLQELALSGTLVTNNGLVKLQDLRNLERLHVTRTRVTKEGIKALQQSLRTLEISD